MRFENIARVFSEEELLFLEDAMRKYENDNLSEKGQDVLDDLKSNIISARRWKHYQTQFQR